MIVPIPIHMAIRANSEETQRLFEYREGESLARKHEAQLMALRVVKAADRAHETQHLGFDALESSA